MAGYVESVRPEGGAVRVSGWAADPRKRARVRRVFAFVDGRPVGSARLERPRGDLVGNYGPSAILGGYELGAALPDGAEPLDVRVFAVLGDRASELPRLGDGDQHD